MDFTVSRLAAEVGLTGSPGERIELDGPSPIPSPRRQASDLGGCPVGDYKPPERALPKTPGLNRFLHHFGPFSWTRKADRRECEGPGPRGPSRFPICPSQLSWSRPPALLHVPRI